MEAVLFIGHGSRVQAGNKQFLSFINRVMAKLPLPIQEVAFIELTQPTILEGIQRCSDQGATKIFVQPVLLLEAGHAKKDIPKEIEKAKEKYPEVQFIYGSPIGVDNRMVDIVFDRLNEKGLWKNEIGKKNVSVLLVGRGSSDKEAKADFEEIAYRLKVKLGLKEVKTCYLAATTPTFEEGLNQMLTEDHEVIYVLPYLLFTGVLMKTMGRKIKELQQTHTKPIHLCNFLGYHEQVQDVIRSKTLALMEGQYHEFNAN
ncbi:sirohydrochlorin chelatase [Alkalihalobacterium alkalinitrilicum]|uniref:sirohydrochlorin chelatase n=1 Tax=Alkalihalobacterium alkalinitrilicum TaxID=427920 RepID=UPI000994AA25|nr:sirohydrochlorin chelatase [Alkalihalobacterium alkalinitrilicum]